MNINYHKLTIGTSTNPVRILLHDCCPETDMFQKTPLQQRSSNHPVHDFGFFHKMLHRLASTDLFPVGYIFTPLTRRHFNTLSAWYMNVCTTPVHMSYLPPSTFSTDWTGLQRDLKASSNCPANKLLNFGLPLHADTFIINMDIFLKVILARAWGTAKENYFIAVDDYEQSTPTEHHGRGVGKPRWAEVRSIGMFAVEMEKLLGHRDYIRVLIEDPSHFHVDVDTSLLVESVHMEVTGPGPTPSPHCRENKPWQPVMAQPTRYTVTYVALPDLTKSHMENRSICTTEEGTPVVTGV